MNDEDLKPANENPWYILMTLYGEQEGEEVDRELAEKNRKLWNAWSCQALMDDERVEAAKLSGIDLAETEWTEEIKKEVKKRYAAEFKCRNKAESVPEMPGSFVPIELSNIILSKAVILDRMIFGFVSSFDHVNFMRAASFSRATFAKAAFFSYATFTQTSNFSGAFFSKESYFSRATFLEDVNFSRANFAQHVDFSSTTFTVGASFSHAAFLRDARFFRATFREAVTFSNASFKETSNFFDATFTQTADFSLSTFTLATSFSGAKFLQAARFFRAKFTQDADFSSATFKQTSVFSGATFEGVAGFGNATFAAEPNNEQAIDFSGVQMNGPVNFEPTTFKHHYPKLTNATLHKSVHVTADEDHWPKLASIQNHQEAKDATAKLRHAMGQQGLPEEEHFFFRREMQSIQRAGWWWKSLHIEYFELFSAFGYSIVRPLVWLFIVWALGVWGYASAATLSWSIGKAAAYSGTSIFSFFGFHRTFMRDEVLEITDAGGGYELFSSIQTIAGFILLFFLGLGLRTRFRLR